MSTLTVRSASAPTGIERLLLDGSAALEGMALRHMHRRTATTDIERRRVAAADARRDAQAAAGLQLPPR